jgi:glycosyltransferase involved in cell wall biosynthesis
LAEAPIGLAAGGFCGLEDDGLADVAQTRARRHPGDPMKLAVITPVGPGHDDIVRHAMASVDNAYQDDRFSSIRHVVIDDHAGRLGRSHARNIGMGADADWFFFLDADDTMRPDALTLANLRASATFGAISLDGRVIVENVHPCGWRQVALNGARGTLSMGCFVRADVARALQFNEDIDAGEDFDFYMRLPGFVKVARPLVDIGYNTPSAGGPRGYDTIDWTEICNDIVARYVTAAPPERYGLRGDAVLAAVGGVKAKPGDLPGTVSV